MSLHRKTSFRQSRKTAARAHLISAGRVWAGSKQGRGRTGKKNVFGKARWLLVLLHVFLLFQVLG